MSNIPTLRMRNRKRKNNNPLLKLRKHKPFQDSSSVEINNASQNLLHDSFTTISRDISISSDITLSETKTQFPTKFAESQYLTAHQDQDDYQDDHQDQDQDDQQKDENDDDVLSYYSDLQESEEGEVNDLQEFEESEDEINVTNFTFEKPTTQLPGSTQGEFSPYFANFTEMSFFTWVTKHSICKLKCIEYSFHYILIW